MCAFGLELPRLEEKREGERERGEIVRPLERHWNTDAKSRRVESQIYVSACVEAKCFSFLSGVCGRVPSL